jgi:hypothetical protein
MTLRRFGLASIQTSPIRRRTTAEKLLFETMAAPVHQKPHVRLHKVTQEILSFWHVQGLSRNNPDTKYTKTANLYISRLLSGTMFNNAPGFTSQANTPFTVDQIKKSISNFATAATCSQYEPRNKAFLQKVKLGDFIYNGFAAGPNGRTGRSFFLQYLNTRPKKIITEIVVPNQFPKIAELYKAWYKRVVLGGVDAALSEKDENHFKLAARKTNDFLIKNRSKFVAEMNIDLLKLAKLTCEAILSDNQNKVHLIQPSWISSNHTFERRLPAYLSYQGVISESSQRQYSMYDKEQ